MAVGENLRRLRRKRRYSQEELADLFYMLLERRPSIDL